MKYKIIPLLALLCLALYAFAGGKPGSSEEERYPTDRVVTDVNLDSGGSANYTGTYVYALARADAWAFPGLAAFSPLSDSGADQSDRLAQRSMPANVPFTRSMMWTNDNDRNKLLETGDAVVTCGVINAADPVVALFEVRTPVTTAGSYDLVGGNYPVWNRPEELHPASWSFTNLGSVFGLTVDRERNIYATASSSFSPQLNFLSQANGTAATVNFQSGTGTIGRSASGGPNASPELNAAGTVYQLDAATGTPTVFAVLPQQAVTANYNAFGVFVPGGNLFLSEGTRTNTGPGLGNIAFDSQNEQFLASNFEDGKIYRIAADGTVDLTGPFDFGTPDNGAAGMPALGDRVWAVAVYDGRVYYSVWTDLMCTNGNCGTVTSTSNNLYDNSPNDIKPIIRSVALDPTTGAFLPATDQLEYNGADLEHTAPISDIAFDADGNMLIAQKSMLTDYASYNHRSQAAYLTGGNGSWTADPFFTGPRENPTNANRYGTEAYGGVDFGYDGTDIDATVWYSSADMIRDENIANGSQGPHGVAGFLLSDLAGTNFPDPRAIIPYDGTVTSPNSTDLKGSGGDIEIVGDYVSLGNLVWEDTNDNGLLDGAEAGIANVTVNLLNAAGTVVLETTTTNAAGQYLFTDLLPGDYIVEIVPPDGFVSSTGSLLLAGTGPFEPAPDPDMLVAIDSDDNGTTVGATIRSEVVTLEETDEPTGEAGLTDLTDFVADNSANYTVDFGLIPTAVFDLALIKTVNTAATPGPFSPDSTVTFSITVYNQGDTDATDIEVKDYVPAGLSLAPASAPDWTVSADTAILTTPFALAAGEDSTLSISFVIDTDFMGDTLVNRAEISAFDDDNDPLTDPPVDEDSTPNDNGMDDPEAATPDELDDDGNGTPGTEDDPNDEDDYDFEGIPVLQNFDLALIKRIDLGATPGPFTYGSTVTFSIDVTNQGSLDATDVEVADYIPDGLTLVPSAIWTMDVDTARLALPFDLAAGATENLSISFTIDLDFAGNMIDNVAEISAAENALNLPDEDSTPGDNGNDDPEVDTDNEANDDGPNGNGTADNPADADDFDFARVSIETVSLGSTVFLDNNNDGLQNTIDTGIANVEVQLFDALTMMQILTDANGARVLDAADAATVTTDANGDYHFTNLLPGDYYVVIPTAPATAPLSSNNTGIAFLETDPDDDTDNDDEGVQVSGSGTSVSSDTITLSLGGEPVNGTTAGTESSQGNTQDDAFDDNGNMTLDFGFFAPVSVGDTAFVDLDGDGLQTMGEPGIGGVTVVLIGTDGDTVMVDADGNMISGVTMTDSDGSYLFPNLPPGSYSVIFDISTADNAEFYDFTTANVGVDTDDSDNSVSLSDSTAQSDFVPFLNSGEEDLSLDVGVVCAIEVVVADPFTICSTQPIVLNDGASITPASLGGSWSTPDGTGEFTTGMDFASATTYTPSKADAQRGSVTLILTTNEPDGPCDAVSTQVTIQILNVDCGDFPWDDQ